ncbi:MAG: SDR family NAD(P)-dependent oxidoreductase [Porticoccaceae bacterium]|nr:SDR family NAD(P)-dependent oxidoreductase [Porticoccaceae bacterium]MDG1473477.1 SDR family NAD(P)-dependent oxidoreductase [Porticoccaceae bacterium]
MTIGQKNSALVLGSSGGLGAAILMELVNDPSIDRVFAVSRSQCPQQLIDGGERGKVVWLQTEYSESAMVEVTKSLAPHSGGFSRVCICHGVLHTDTLKPEKRLEDLNEASLQSVFHSNAVIPGIWLKLLFPILKGSTDCIVAALSARVGSISDNNLGGWYAYRASKAALNMILKTAAIEYGRRVKNVKLIAFHPGTTDTDLSKPFQATVPTGKLFTPSFVAEQLAIIMDTVKMDGTVSFLDWNGQSIDW